MLSKVTQFVKRLTKWHWLAIVIAVPVITAFVNHWWPLYGGPVRGVVVDTTTSQPLADAVVVVKWRGGLGGVHGPRFLCYHVALAHSDAAGKFYVPSWFYDVITGNGPDWLASIDAQGMDRPIEYTAYKVGYVIEPLHYPVAVGKEIVVKMEPVKGTTIKRLSYLEEMVEREAMCEADDKTLIPVYQAAYEEGKFIASSPEELKMADSLLTELESAQFGNSEALDRKGARRLKRLTEQQNGSRK